MVGSLQPQKMSIETYLDWEACQEVRHEYIKGEIFAMTGGTVPHNDIALNLYRAIYPHVRSKGCRINVSDVKVQVSPTSSYFYPDVVVSCDSRDLNARQFIQYPKLIVEVLSPSTEAKDRGDKFTSYRMMTTLQEYVLIDSEKVSVECYRRGEGRMWLYTPYTNGDSVALDSIGWSGPIEQIYEEVQCDR